MSNILRRLAGLVLSAAAATVAASATTALAADPPKRPNVLIILADDLGWNAVGYHHGYARTPNIDRIARQGVELDRNYVSPMCSPTRAGIMTGRYPMHFGMARSVVRPWAHAGLPAEERTIAEYLAAAGYKDRVAFGKWHLGHLAPEYHPLAQGFTHFVGCYNGAADYFTRERDGQIDWHDDYKDIDPKGYTTDIIADHAEQFIRDHQKSDGPFLCYVAFTAVHEPAQAPDSYINKYPDLKGEKKILAAQDECMDDGIGRILKALEDTGIQSDTLVWFLSDNGGIRAIPNNNDPLREGKLTCYEGGIRTPAAVWWPGVIEGGRKLESPVVNVDILPTVLHAAGASPDPAAKPLDGVDLLPALTSSSPAPQRDVFAFTGQQGLEHEQISVMTPDNWKLIITGPDIRRPEGPTSPPHKVELFNLADDPNETTDLAAKEPERVKALAAKAVAFRQSEPPHPLLPINRRPRDFSTPPNWHNGPAGQ